MKYKESSLSTILNRIAKNDKRLKPWAKRKGFEAYRIYDLDIPEYPFLLDKYKDQFVFYDRSNPGFSRDQEHLAEAKKVILEYFQIQPDDLIIKERQRQKGLDQYEKLAEKQIFKTVQEGSLFFRVNLNDYLDTGLFLDHRPLREKLVLYNSPKNVLNLFCYTGSLSVAAAKSGAHVTSVDMSSTYLAWAEENFKINNLQPQNHSFLRQDVLQFLNQPEFYLGHNKKFDLILLDPPTFSNSKKMADDFEVERDQDFLITNCMKILTEDGLLIFSNNKRKFKISKKNLDSYQITDITEKSIPQDFHNKSIHSCYEIRHKL